MSHTATTWAWSVWKMAPSAPALLVLLKLADMARDSGKVWPSHKYLADRLPLSQRTIRSALDALEGCGLLKREERVGHTDLIWLQLSPTMIFADGPEDDDHFEGGSRGRPRKTPATGAATPDKTPAGDATKPREPSEEPDGGGDLRARDPFDQWWTIYPRKQAKLDARKAWKAVPAKIGIDDLMELTRRFADHVVGKDPEKIPHPATWLNGERWLDELPNRSQTDGSTRTTSADRANELSPGGAAMVEGARLAAAAGRRRWAFPGS